MAKKRKRRSAQIERAPQAVREKPDRRTRKDEARRARDAARKRARRRTRIRRLASLALVGGVALVAFLLLSRASGPGSLRDDVLRAAAAAGCATDEPVSPAGNAPGNQHATAGQVVTSTQKPPTSGLHYSDRILPPSPHIYTEAVDEIAAIHNLEHAYVILYYRARGEEALPPTVVDALTGIAEDENKVILAPSESLEDGTSLAFTAWNKLWECPAGITPDQAGMMARGFIEAYRGTSNAPEPLSP